MAVRKINESTLTAIGNAIRSKTGGSALINPEDMATEIESIQTGGASPWELIVDHTSEERTQTVRADIPQEYQTENIYKVQITVEFTRTEYPYFGLNGGSSSYESSIPYDVEYSFVGYIVKAGRTGQSYTIAISNSKYTTANDPLLAQSVFVKSYYENAIKAGCNIKIWRLVE